MIKPSVPKRESEHGRLVGYWRERVPFSNALVAGFSDEVVMVVALKRAGLYVQARSHDRTDTQVTFARRSWFVRCLGQPLVQFRSFDLHHHSADEQYARP